MKTKCRISSATKEALQAAINKYYFSTNWIITEDNKTYNTKTEKFLDGYIVKHQRGRWQLLEVIEA